MAACTGTVCEATNGRLGSLGLRDVASAAGFTVAFLFIVLDRTSQPQGTHVAPRPKIANPVNI